MATDASLPKCAECGQPLRPGATGRFPHGQIDKGDEGELRAVISIHNGRVRIEFGKSITWLAMNATESMAFADKLTELAHKLGAGN